MPPLAGERWWRQPPKGDCISSPAGRLYGFRRQRRHKKWRRRRRTSPAQRYYITPEGGALNPSGRRQPVPDRTLGAQGQRPGGAINPRPRKRASTFGNTGKHRPDPDPDRTTGALIIPPTWNENYLYNASYRAFSFRSLSLVALAALSPSYR